MAVNKYAGPCRYCGARVPPRGGRLKNVSGRWTVSHLACSGSKSPRVHTIRFSGSGQTYIRNSNGRCEDAPCCGCCTI